MNDRPRPDLAGPRGPPPRGVCAVGPRSGRPGLCPPERCGCAEAHRIGVASGGAAARRCTDGASVTGQALAARAGRGAGDAIRARYRLGRSGSGADRACRPAREARRITRLMAERGCLAGRAGRGAGRADGARGRRLRRAGRRWAGAGGSRAAELLRGAGAYSRARQLGGRVKLRPGMPEPRRRAGRAAGAGEG